jgi:hypothetical protein
MRRVAVVLMMLVAAVALALSVTGATSSAFADNGVISSHN